MTEVPVVSSTAPVLGPLDVCLVETVSPTESIHQFHAKHVSKLTRRNKLSSHPFWAPNDQIRAFQFKIILLRGVEKAEMEEDDSIGVFLEYVPTGSSQGGESGKGNDGSQGEASSTTTASPETHPNGTSVTCTCICRNDPSQSITQKDTITYSRNDRTVGFRSVFPACYLKYSEEAEGEQSQHRSDKTGGEQEVKNESRSEGEEKSETKNNSEKTRPASVPLPPAVIPNFLNREDDGLLIEIRIHTNVSTVVSALAQTTDRLTSSIWKGASTTFSFWWKKAPSIAENIKHSVANAAHQFEQLASRSEATSGEQDPHQLPPPPLPWAEIPPKWRGREEKWVHWVTVALPENELTFLEGPDNELSPEAQVMMAQLGISHKTVKAANSLFTYEKDVHPGLITCSALRMQRFCLVPRVIDDKTFWRNYLWKVAALSGCHTDEQASLMISIVNSPTDHTQKQMDVHLEGQSHSPEGKSSPLAVGEENASLPPSEAEVVKVIGDAHEAKSLVRELMEEDGSSNGTMLQSAAQSCRSLRRSVMNLKLRFPLAASPHHEVEESPDEDLRLRSEKLALCLQELDATLEMYMYFEEHGCLPKASLPKTAVTNAMISSSVTKDADNQPPLEKKEDEKEGGGKNKKEEKEKEEGEEKLDGKKKNDNSSEEQDMFGDLPTIEDAHTPPRDNVTSESNQEPSSTPEAHSQSLTKGGSSVKSGGSSDFAVMPWEEE